MSTTASKERWLLYACRTSAYMSLDPLAYPSTLFDGRPIAWPPWACKAPDGGIHIDNTVGRIDVHLTKSPRRSVDFHWTHNFGVHIIANHWLDEIRDLIDESRIFLGDVRVRGNKITGWSTVHEPGAPPLLASAGTSKTCPICGNYYTTLWGKLSIGDPTAVGRPLFVNSKGVFIREQLALSRNISKPSGVFKPRAVIQS
jgi:hypothetical protein